MRALGPARLDGRGPVFVNDSQPSSLCKDFPTRIPEFRFICQLHNSKRVNGSDRVTCPPPQPRKPQAANPRPRRSASTPGIRPRNFV